MSRCRPFSIVGFNAYDLCELAMAPPTPISTPPAAAAVLANNVTASSSNNSNSSNTSAATAEPHPPVLLMNGRELVVDSLARAAALGMNTLRTWAHTSNPDTPFQVRRRIGFILNFHHVSRSYLGVTWELLGGTNDHDENAPPFPPLLSLPVYRRPPGCMTRRGWRHWTL